MRNGPETLLEQRPALTTTRKDRAMATRADITPELCRQLLRYEPETGKLFWRERTPDLFQPKGRRTANGCCNNWNSRYAGTEALSQINQGRRGGPILNLQFSAHRVIWCIAHGYWPQEIDHINGDAMDNRLCNLREVEHSENQKNLCIRKDNSSGILGVGWSKKEHRWVARIRSDGKSYRLGAFRNLADAGAARAEAERRFGFHPNHGKR